MGVLRSELGLGLERVMVRVRVRVGVAPCPAGGGLATGTVLAFGVRSRSSHGTEHGSGDQEVGDA